MRFGVFLPDHEIACMIDLLIDCPVRFEYKKILFEKLKMPGQGLYRPWRTDGSGFVLAPSSNRKGKSRRARALVCSTPRNANREKKEGRRKEKKQMPTKNALAVVSLHFFVFGGLSLSRLSCPYLLPRCRRAFWLALL